MASNINYRGVFQYLNHLISYKFIQQQERVQMHYLMAFLFEIFFSIQLMLLNTEYLIETF